MPGGLISYALLAALATALVIAAVTDVRRRQIDNALNAAIAIAAPLYWLAAGLGWRAAALQLGLAAATFVVACALFAMRQMGGGDVKLLTALALWFVPGSFLQLIVLMGVVGGAASIALALYNMGRVPGESLWDNIATLVAALWVLGACAILYAVATGRPLIQAEVVRTFLAAAPGGLLVAGGIILIVLVTLGLAHIVRRQRGQIAIPYGVAIASAGLWILAHDTFSGPLTSVPQG